MSNLANVHARLREFTKAKELHLRALAIREKGLGPDHPAVGQSLGNLADLLHEIGDLAAAKTAAERALAIREKTLVATHPDLANGLQNLAGIELSAGKSAVALPLLERAVAIYEMHSGTQEGELGARFALARALVAEGGDATRARAEAEKAREGLRAAGRMADAGEIDAWLAAHPP
jgi:tetratricopeptide (TPR) repeat protein